MENEKLEKGKIEYGEEEREKAVESLKRQFEDFNGKAQSAVLELLNQMVVGSRDFGENRLEDVLRIMGDDLFTAKFWGANRDNRGENLALLGRQEDNLVGKALTVREIRDILKKQ